LLEKIFSVGLSLKLPTSCLDKGTDIAGRELEFDFIEGRGTATSRAVKIL